MLNKMIGVGCAAVMFTCLGTVSASGATKNFQDVEGEARTDMDLYSGVLRHTEKAVAVETAHKNVRRSLKAGGSLAVYIDTDPQTPGPDFAVVAGTTDGADYSLVHVREWEFGDALLDAKIGLEIDYDAETVQVRVPRRAIGKPDEVRIAVRTEGVSDKGDLETDWLRTIHHLTPWVASG